MSRTTSFSTYEISTGDYITQKQYFAPHSSVGFRKIDLQQFLLFEWDDNNGSSTTVVADGQISGNVVEESTFELKIDEYGSYFFDNKLIVKCLIEDIDIIHNYNWELCILDPVSAEIRLLKEINPGGSSDSAIEKVTSYKEGVVFVARDGVHGHELWYSNGQESTTELFLDINPGEYSSSPENIRF